MNNDNKQITNDEVPPEKPGTTGTLRRIMTWMFVGFLIGVFAMAAYGYFSGVSWETSTVEETADVPAYVCPMHEQGPEHAASAQDEPGECEACGMALKPREEVLGEKDREEEKSSGDVEEWTCAMHPSVRMPRKGVCPFCGMDLEPAPKDDFVRLNKEAKRRAGVATVPVKRRYVDHEVTMYGEVDYAHTSMETITARVPGRIERLFLDHRGMKLRKGDHMYQLYSPELRNTHRDLMQAKETLGKAKTKETAAAARRRLESIRERLRNWGLLKEQIRELEQAETPSRRITLKAPRGGTVTKIFPKEGDYVNEGSRIFTIVDLSKVWVVPEPYESDLQWLRYGQSLNVQTEAYPGKSFEGWVKYIEPWVDAKTRTTQLHAEIPNPDGRLKPGMYAEVTVKATLASEGNVVEPDLKDKYICRMHPSEVKQKPGKCPQCGMDLSSPEELGYKPMSDAEPPLVIPDSAPLITGKRAIVYLEVPGTEKPTYEGRVVQLGPRTKNHYIVKSGLREGEQIVYRGNFKLDSEMQIRNLPSMLHNPEKLPASYEEAMEQRRKSDEVKTGKKSDKKSD